MNVFGPGHNMDRGDLLRYGAEEDEIDGIANKYLGDHRNAELPKPNTWNSTVVQELHRGYASSSATQAKSSQIDGSLAPNTGTAKIPSSAEGKGYLHPQIGSQSHTSHSASGRGNSTQTGAALEEAASALVVAESEIVQPLRTRVDTAIENLAFQRLSGALGDLQRIVHKRKLYFAAVLFARIPLEDSFQRVAAEQFAKKLERGVQAIQAARNRELTRAVFEVRRAAYLKTVGGEDSWQGSATNSNSKEKIGGYSSKKNEIVFKPHSSGDSGQKKVLDYNSPQISKHKKGLMESPKGAALHQSQSGHGLLTQNRFDSLKKEHLQLTKEEKDSEAKIESLRNDIDKLRQQIVSLNSSSNHNTPKSQTYSGDGSLELLLLDKKIRELANQNMGLRQELSAVAHDTTQLIKQVTDLVSKSESSVHAFKSASTLGLLQSAETLGKATTHVPALNSDR